MKWTACLGVFAVLTLGVASAQDAPQPPAVQKEHEWLKQLDGEWTTETEATFEPGKPPVKCQGTESTKTLGGYWSVAEIRCDMTGAPMTGLMTVGYDAEKKKFVGTWVCSMCDQMVRYEGKVDGQVLTLECEAPNPQTGKVAKMRDTITVLDKDHKRLVSTMLGEDGKWVTFMTATSTRKAK